MRAHARVQMHECTAHSTDMKRCHVHAGVCVHGPARADDAAAPRRVGRRHSDWLRAALWRANGLWRSPRSVPGMPRRLQALNARWAGRAGNRAASAHPCEVRQTTASPHPCSPCLPFSLLPPTLSPLPTTLALSPARAWQSSHVRTMTEPASVPLP